MRYNVLRENVHLEGEGCQGRTVVGTRALSRYGEAATSIERENRGTEGRAPQGEVQTERNNVPVRGGIVAGQRVKDSLKSSERARTGQCHPLCLKSGLVREQLCSPLGSEAEHEAQERTLEKKWTACDNLQSISLWHSLSSHKQSCISILKVYDNRLCLS